MVGPIHPAGPAEGAGRLGDGLHNVAFTKGALEVFVKFMSQPIPTQETLQAQEALISNVGQQLEQGRAIGVSPGILKALAKNCPDPTNNQPLTEDALKAALISEFSSVMGACLSAISAPQSTIDTLNEKMAAVGGIDYQHELQDVFNWFKSIEN